ncbi:hypothetical protein ACO1O0_007030 [Amphichorda felina]
MAVFDSTSQSSTGRLPSASAVEPQSTLKESPVSQFEITKSQYEALLKEALKNIGVTHQPEQRPYVELKDLILSRIHDVTSDQKLADRASTLGALVTVYFFPLHNKQTQLLIGLYSANWLIMDDTGKDMGFDIGRFKQRLITQEQQPPLFKLEAWLFSEFDKVFPSMVANKIVAGALNAISSLEVEIDESVEFKGLASPDFPRYFRNMTGTSEPYVYFLLTNEVYSMARLKHFIRAVPELWNFTDEINDLMSFYKESIVGTERDTYVYHQTQFNETTIIEVLRGLGEDIRRRVKLIDEIFADDEVLQKLAREYVFGNVHFYFASERYRIKELQLF